MALTCAIIDQTYNSYTCDNSSPGIDTCYLINCSNVTGVTISSGNVITSITTTGSSTFYEARPYTETMDASAIGTVNANGNVTFLHNLKFKLNAVTTESRDLGFALFRANTYAIVKTTSGKYWFYGLSDATSPELQKGLTGKKSDMLNGVTTEDFSGIDLELEGKLSKFPFEVDASIVTSSLVTSA